MIDFEKMMELATKTTQLTKPTEAQIELQAKIMAMEGYAPLDVKAFAEMAKIKAETVLGRKIGVLLHGRCGTGKTLALTRVFNAEVTSTMELSDIYSSGGISAIDEIMTPRIYSDCMMYGNVGIDDIGAEEKGKHYGEVIDIISHIIDLRYKYFKSHGAITHITTNLTYKEMVARYGDRVMSRVLEMCHVIKIEIRDQRIINSRT